MENFEVDSVQEGAEGIDPSALERAQEKARENAKQAKKDKSKEAKQKQNEGALYDIVLQVIDHLGYNHELSRLLVQAMSYNVPSKIILASVALIFDSIQEYMGMNLIKDEKDSNFDQNKTLLPQIQNQDMNLKVKLNLNEWLSNFDSIIFEDPKFNFQKVLDPYTKDTLKKPLIDLLSYSNQEYFQRENVDFNPQNVINFINLFSENIIDRLVKFKDNQFELEAQNTPKEDVNFEDDPNS